MGRVTSGGATTWAGHDPYHQIYGREVEGLWDRIMHRVCICLPRQLAQLGEAVVSKCSADVSQRVKFTQCDVDDPGKTFIHHTDTEDTEKLIYI